MSQKFVGNAGYIYSSHLRSAHPIQLETVRIAGGTLIDCKVSISKFLNGSEHILAGASFNHSHSVPANSIHACILYIKIL